MMKHIVNIIAFVLTFAAVAFADWDTELFDGESKRWGYGYERSKQCYTAVVERANATWGEGGSNNVAVTPRWWGSSWTLKEAKDDVENMLSSAYWVDTTEESDGNYDAWFSSGTNAFPRLNTSNILVNASAPTNWFEFNPHWGTVTHSNGWEYLDDVVNGITKIEKNLSVDVIEEKKWTDYSATGQLFSNTWAGAKIIAEDIYDNPSPPDEYGTYGYYCRTNEMDAYFSFGTYTTSARYDSDQWSAHISSKRVKFIVENDNDNYAVNWSMYWNGAGYGITNYFDSGLTNKTEELVSLWIPAGGTATSEWFGTYWPSSGDTEWCRAATTDDPGTPYYFYSITEGYYTDYEDPKYFILDYDVPDGFEYVEEN